MREADWLRDLGGQLLRRVLLLLGLGDELLENLGAAVLQLQIGQPPAIGEGLVGLADGQVLLDHARSACAERPTELRLGPDRPEHPGAGADDRYRLSPEGVLAEGT